MKLNNSVCYWNKPILCYNQLQGMQAHLGDNFYGWSLELRRTKPGQIEGDIRVEDKKVVVNGTQNKM